MPRVVSAGTVEELPDVLALLRGATASLGDATVDDDELTVPFEFVDVDHAQIHRSSVPGASPGSVPLLRAYLVIDHVLECDWAVPDEAGVGRLDISFDPAQSTWTLQVHPRSVITLHASALSASVTVTDEPLGDQSLRMRM